MAHEVKTQPCPECGGLMRYEKHDDVLEYQGHKRTIKTLGWWCTKCGEAILTGDPLVRHERAFLQLKAEVDGVLGPKEVARVREGLGLSQRTAGELLGGGPRGFQKYESGKQAVSTAMSHLLRLLAKDPSRLGDLAYSAEQLNEIYDKTEGYCACCGKKLAFTNHGLGGGTNAKGRWEVAHRRAGSKGGGDRLPNLWALCVECNRDMSTADATRVVHREGKTPVRGSPFLGRSRSDRDSPGSGTPVTRRAASR